MVSADCDVLGDQREEGRDAGEEAGNPDRGIRAREDDKATKKDGEMSVRELPLPLLKGLSGGDASCAFESILPTAARTTRQPPDERSSEPNRPASR